MPNEIRLGVSNYAYHADHTAVGQSGIKAMLKSPAYFWGRYRDPDCPPDADTETPARRFGNMVHCALFERQHFTARYPVGPDCARNLKEWKDWAKNLVPEADGIKPAEYKAIQQVRRSVESIPDIAAALSVGHGEVSAYWRDELTGLRCKCRPDWVNPVGDDAVVLLDGKTYNSADPDEFTKQVAKMDYHLQAAWYTDGYAAASGKRVLAFVFLVIEDKWPHQATAMMLDQDSLEQGRRKYRRGLNLLAQCERDSSWPGHGTDVKLIQLPSWAKE